MNRFLNFVKMVIDLLFENVEQSVPLERRLAYDRQRRAGQVKGMLDKATDIGQYYEMVVQDLARAKIGAASIREEIENDLRAAKAAKARGDTASEQDNLNQAAALADDLAEAEKEVAELEQSVAESLQDKEGAKQMVLQQAADLAKLARHDASLVAQVRRSEMKVQVGALREALLDLIPEDRDNIRGRALQRATQQEARVRARTELVDALWKLKNRGKLDRRTQISSRGAQILTELQGKVDYQPSKAMPESVETQQARTAAS